MGKIFLLAKSNFRKNIGTSIGLFFLMLISTALIGMSMLIFLDVKPTAEKEARRLNAGDGFIWVVGSSKIDEDALYEIIKNDVEDSVVYSCLGCNDASVPFGDGNIVISRLLINDRHAFDRDIDRIEIITEDTSIIENYIYLPYQFYTGSGFNIGEEYSFDLFGNSRNYTIRGFINTTYYGCNNDGSFLFILDDDNYASLYEESNSTSNAMIVTYFLKEGVAANKFSIRVLNDILVLDGECSVNNMQLDEVLANRSFLSTIISVSFLVVTLVLVCVVALVLANSVANYIKENYKTIGALKAIGYTGSNIKTSLNILFVVLTIVGSSIGIITAYLMMPLIATIVVAQMGLPYTVSFNALCTFIPIVAELFFVFVVAAFSTRKISKIDPILALRDGTEAHNFKKNFFRLDKSVANLNVSLSLKHFTVNIKQNIITFVVTGLMVFCCVIAVMLNENFNRHPKLEMLTFEICDGVVAIDYEKKDEAREFLESIEDVSNVRNIIGLGISYKDEESLYTYIMDDATKMNNTEVCYKGRLPLYDNEICVSGKFAKQYGYNVGDEIEMHYGDNYYKYLLTGLIQTCNNNGREAILTMDAAEHIMDLEYSPAYYWFDCVDKDNFDTILDKMSEKYGSHVIGAVNFSDTIEGGMTTFRSVSLMMLVVIMCVSVIVITLVFFLLIKSLVYSKRREYGIYKALGYTTNSLIFQTAFSFMPSVILSVIVFSVVTYYLANPYMSMLMGSFGLMKCTFNIPVGDVVVMGVGLIIVSMVIAIVQSGRVRKIEAYNMLIGE